MKLLQVSDLHIGIRLKSYDLKEEQLDVLSQMILAAKKHIPDVFVIAGDIYDKSVPTAEAVGIFDEFITGLRAAVPDMKIVIISGNHDSQERLQLFGNILSDMNIFISGVTPKTSDEYIKKIEVEDEFGIVNIYPFPFIKPAFVRNVVDKEIHSYDEAFEAMLNRENIDFSERNVLVSHQFFVNEGQEIERSSSEITTVGNIDSIPVRHIRKFDYVALGHIHKPMSVGESYIRYSGTPFQYSIDEANQSKSMLLVTVGEKGKPVEIEKIPIIPIRKVRKISGMFEDILKEKSDDYVVIELLDKEDFNTIDMKMKLKANYPRYLEIRRVNTAKLNFDGLKFEDVEQNVDVFEMFCKFYDDITDEEKDILEDVINTVKEEC